MATCGGLLGWVYRHGERVGTGLSGVYGYICPIPSLVHSVPNVLMGTDRLACDGPPTMATCGKIAKSFLYFDMGFFYAFFLVFQRLAIQKEARCGLFSAAGWTTSL